jgi:uncharacterized protein (DUF952 family)
MSEKIIHLTSRQAWESAQQDGDYRAASLDAEGFIHCSTTDQIVRVANAFYAGQHGLVLLLVEPDALTAELKWEPPAGPPPDNSAVSEFFPHIYGPLNLEAVVEVLPFEPDDSGRFSLPSVLSK